MPQKSQRDDSRQPGTRPILPVRAVARLPLPLRHKLLAGFLGVTLLLAGLAGVGLETLRQANDRTEKLLHAQDRIAYFNELYVFLSDLTLLATAVGIDPKDVQVDATISIFNSTAYVLASSTNNVVLHSGQGLRKYGQPGMPDRVILSGMRSRIKQLQVVADQTAELRRDKGFQAAGTFARQEFIPLATSMQRDAYSRVQDIEAEMARAARTTAQAYQASRQLVIGAALAAIGLATLLGITFSASLTWSLRRIGQTLAALAGGDFASRVTVPNRDELGTLARDVNATSEQLGTLYAQVETQRAELATEHARSERLLNNLLPAQIAARLKRAPDQTIADTLPQVAILFADIVDFTQRTARQAPEDTVEFLNGLFSEFDALAEKHGLEKIKTIGDSYMAAAGLPAPCPDPAHRAAEMALDMCAVARRMPDHVQIRIGLHAGPAIAGVIGHTKPFYDVWGETVNIASRMESHGAPDRIQVTAPARSALLTDYLFEARGTVEIDGLGPLETWWLTGRAPGP